MLDQGVQLCPPDLWIAGEYPRYTWRVVWHAALFTQVYMVQNYEEYKPWPGGTNPAHADIWNNPAYFEPYELPDGLPVLEQAEALAYIRWIYDSIEPTINSLDIDSPDSGIEWYPGMTKISHELLNLRHLQGHVGQLSELLMARGIDIDWVSRGRDPRD